MNGMILDAAVLAEAVALAGIITLAIRMRIRLNRLDTTPDYRATVLQMAELVAEAQALSTDLAEQIAGQVQVAESLMMHAQSQKAAVGSPAPAAPPTQARKAAAKAAAEAPKAVAASQAPVRARASRGGVAAAEAPVDETANDLAEARKRGMDPLGVALQRALQRRTATA